MITINYAGLSDTGRVRTTNEDRWFADPDHGFFLVADGIRGTADGGLAAQIVAEVLPRLLRRKLDELQSPTQTRNASFEVAHFADSQGTRSMALQSRVPESRKDPALESQATKCATSRSASEEPSEVTRRVSEGASTAALGAGLPTSPEPPTAGLPESENNPAVSNAADQVSAALFELSEHLRMESQATPGLKGIGSTVVLALVRDGQAIVAHLGDSRAYLLRGGCIRQLTKDHTIAQLLVDRGEITRDDVASHPSRGQLTRFVGMSTDAIAETKCIDLTIGDWILLCSDGLSGAISDQQMLSILSHQPEPEDACRHLVDAANEAGGRDNTTAVIVTVCDYRNGE